MSNNRLGIDQIELLPAMSHSELQALFASRSVTILPSRYDTFNLVALESLFAGCPTAIGSGAGVCRFLEETYPEVPFVKIDIHNVYGCIPELIDLLNDYDAYRERLVRRLSASQPVLDGIELRQIYNSAAAHDAPIRRELADWYQRLMRYSSDRPQSQASCQAAPPAPTPSLRRTVRALHPRLALGAAKRRVVRHTSYGFRHRLRSAVTSAKAVLRGRPNDAPAAAPQDPALAHLRSLVDTFKQIHWTGEVTPHDLDTKLARCAEVVSALRIDRVRLWREMARIETMRGNDLVAATYRLRAMRALGVDRCGDLPAVMQTLQAAGYQAEARAAQAMYAGSDDAADQCHRILEEAAASHGRQPEWDYALIDDRRERRPYKVSVIVSLYNAADKLPFFLRALQTQSLVQAGQAEIILVDSGSPTDEYAVFRQLASELPMQVAYVRSARRETIQSAWNRGISLSRAPYLSFLGVDEGVVPHALETLAAELDADPALDWVQANSIVTNVNDRGHWLSDVMTYDRTGYRQSMVYLETCYLSWVGALYRRSIHDRFGLYDLSFAAAGDTEFKNRVLRGVKTKAIPQLLGIFWNYPSDRTTCSPRAEIEDLRAWYLHRTLGGVRYAFEGRDPAAAEEAFFTALNYRKSYCGHLSSDIEYACNVAAFLSAKAPRSAVSAYRPGGQAVLNAYRNLDQITETRVEHFNSALTNAAITARDFAEQCRQLSGGTLDPSCQVFHDNRHEQHTQIWPTEVQTTVRWAA